MVFTFLHIFPCALHLNVQLMVISVYLHSSTVRRMHLLNKYVVIVKYPCKDLIPYYLIPYCCNLSCKNILSIPKIAHFFQHLLGIAYVNFPKCNDSHLMAKIALSSGSFILCLNFDFTQFGALTT